MRYLLTTGHRYPKFYKVDGAVVDVDLPYVTLKVISEIDEDGQILHREVRGSPPVASGFWLVKSVEEALLRLADEGVYPFKNKSAARECAKRLGLQTFKYIAVP
ncbi:hypothetical protein ABRZ80_20535 [Vibrio vulnificus]|uniref:hypothetical protein n=1 Tax=Vibrio vulnificus TaxID=672 RepID=UPI0032ED2490